MCFKISNCSGTGYVSGRMLIFNLEVSDVPLTLHTKKVVLSRVMLLPDKQAKVTFQQKM